MSLERRRRLGEIANRRELLVLEDNPYGLLRYEGDPLPTLCSLDGGRFVVYLGTFSKILSPGIRIGWAVAPGPVYQKLNTGKQGVDLCSSAFSQAFIAAYFARARWQDYVHALRALYHRRRDVMLEALAESFGPEASWTRPEGGMFVWATLPDYIASLRELYRRRRDTMLDALAEHLPREAAWTRPAGGLFIWARLADHLDTSDLLARALRSQVAFVPGRAAYLDGRGGSEMRLNFSGVDDDSIREGVRRIGEVVREQVALYGTLTGGHTVPAAAPVPAAEPGRLADVLPLPARRRADDGTARDA